MATENGAGMYNSYFSNTYKERVEVVKKDGGNISDEDINEIEAIKGVSEVIDYSVILDYTFNFYFDDNYYNCYIFNADSITEDDLMLGTLPQNKNEVVIGASFSEKQIKDYPSSILDASLFYAYNYDLKIVGVTYVSSSEDKRIYVNDELFKEASILCYAYNYASNVTVELTTPTEVLNYSYVEYDNTITDDKLHIFYFDSSITNVKFNDKEVEFVIHESAIDSKISFGDAFIEKYLYNGREQVTVNLSNYNQLASVSTKLKALGYYYVSPYVSSTSYDIVFLLEILALITTIPIFLITFFATYLVIKIILLSKKRDYTILRTVGIDNKIIKNMNKLELLISYNVSFLILIILFILFKSLRIDAISVYLDVITFKKAIIIYIISIVFAMFISLRFNRLLIKRSLLSTLRQGE